MAEQSLQEQYAPENSCWGCGPSNREGLRIRSFAKNGEVVAEWQPQPKYEAFPGRFEWRNHWHVARLSLQLDGGLPFDETRRRRSSAVHRHGRIFNQTAAADSDEGSNFTFSARCRSNRRPRHSRRNIEWRRKSLRDLSGNFRRGERRPSSISSLVAIRPTQSAPGVTRTPDLRIRNPLLYPAELRAQIADGT